ncbi:MAG: hypothetical protein COB15_09785 [Flavobacteriales bacterium]|nr:MAG: hypothetical protein COB15_09785 [Flavobacteriales bacterium]
MSNKLLQKLEDTKNRKLPIVFKHVMETVSDKEHVGIGSVYLSPQKNAKTQCFDYYKPISKII